MATPAALIICLLAANPTQAAADAISAPGKTTPAELPMEDGLTRDSLSEHADQESIPPTDPPVAEPSATYHPKRTARRHHRNHLAAASRQTEVAAVHPRRRNPVESFVYVWNGWVVRTFHTRTGTVMLDRIGAKA